MVPYPLDTTQDTSKAGQLCEIYRYCSSEQDVNGKPKALWVIKLFSGIYKVEVQTAAVLSKHILQNTDGNFWKYFNKKRTKLRGL
jgi:hypothetical protein